MPAKAEKNLTPDGKYNQDPYFNYKEYHPDGPTYKEKFYSVDGKLSTNDKRKVINSPSSIEYFPNGVVRLKQYYKDGLRHNDNGNPAYIKYHENGRVAVLTYWLNGKKTKGSETNTLCHLEYDKSGNIEFEGHYDTNGDLIKKVYHYDDYLQVEAYDKDGTILTRNIFVKKVPRRNNFADIKFYKDIAENLVMGDYKGTAGYTRFYRDGKIAEIQHIKNGSFHCSSGPARILYTKDGLIRSQDYFNNDGQMISKEEFEKLNSAVSAEKAAPAKINKATEAEKSFVDAFTKEINKSKINSTSPATVAFISDILSHQENLVKEASVNNIADVLNNTIDSVNKSEAELNKTLSQAKQLLEDMKKERDEEKQEKSKVVEELKKTKENFENIVTEMLLQQIEEATSNESDNESDNEREAIMKVTKHPNGDIARESFYDADGSLHNANGPADKKYYENGALERISFYINGQRHADNGPAYSTFYPNGSVRFVSFWKNGVKTSEYDEPCHIEYYEDGSVKTERWYHDGDKHRVGGPAVIEYDETGNITKEEFWKGGKLLKQELLKTKTNNGILTNKFTGMVKSDAVNAGYRVASTQITKGVRYGIVSLLQRDGISGEKVDVISNMLDTDGGTALIHMMLGLGLTYVPKFKEDERVQRLAKEFRTEGIAVAGNATIETAMEYIMPHIVEALKAIPQNTEEKEAQKTRVVSLPEPFEEVEQEVSVDDRKTASL